MKNKEILRLVKDKSTSILHTSEAFCSAIDNAWSSSNIDALRAITAIYKLRYKDYGIDKVISLITQEASPLSSVNIKKKHLRWIEYWRPLIIDKGLAELVSFTDAPKKTPQKTVKFDNKLSTVAKAITEIEEALDSLASKKATIKKADTATAEKFLFDSYKLLVIVEAYSRDLNNACEELKPIIKAKL